MSAQEKYQGDWEVSFKRESVVRNNDTAFQAGEGQRWGIIHNFTPPKFKRKFTPVRAGGKIQPTHHIEEGFELQETSLELFGQLYMLWRYVLTNIATAGTTKEDNGGSHYTITYGGSGKTFTYSPSIVTDYSSDDPTYYCIIITSGESTGKIGIIDTHIPGSDSITLLDTPPTTLNGDTFDIIGGPYTYTLTEGRSQPTFAIHSRYPNLASSAQDLIRDYLGCQVREGSITLEQLGDVMFNFTVTAMKEVVGTAIAYGSDPTEAPLVWAHLMALTLQYNSVDVFSNPNILEQCDNIEVVIGNEYEVSNPGGDENPKSEHWTARTWGPKLHLFPTNKTLYDLLATKLASYSGALTFTLQVGRSASDYIKFVFDKLRLIEHSDEWTEQGDYGVDVEFDLGTLASPYIEIKDSYSPVHYGGATLLV